MKLPTASGFRMVASSAVRIEAYIAVEAGRLDEPSARKVTPLGGGGLRASSSSAAWISRSATTTTLGWVYSVAMVTQFCSKAIRKQ